MSEAKFKTMRHIETVRNYLDAMQAELIRRGQCHDQSKLQSPEVEIFEIYTEKLKDIEYASAEYKKNMAAMKPAIKHHQEMNRHHPEHFADGINGMNLIDLLEMMCDWKASGMRMSSGDLYTSLDINKDRFGIGDQLFQILWNTADFINLQQVSHFAEES